jgi:hypothetical protein
MTLMSVVELILWAVLGFLFWTKKLQRRFPAMGAYLALRVASMPALVFFFYSHSQHWLNHHAFRLYFFTYWTVYIVSAVMLYFVCTEVFRSALWAFSGLQRLGIVAFRWAILVSVIVSMSTLSFEHSGTLLVSAIALGLMRSVSMIELCLLAFLCLSMNALGLSVRDKAFGIALGFGVMSSSDFIFATFISRHTSLTDPFQFVAESVILVAIGMWITYCAMPEKVRQPVMIPVNSIIFRWNEIASALGHTGTQVAVQPAGGFFLTDVESAVAKALPKN